MSAPFLNLVVYWSYEQVPHPTRAFDALARLHIDNSFELGWAPDRLLVATNFEWEYRGVRSLRLLQSGASPPLYRSASKLFAFRELLARELIPQNAVVWFHDLDALQNEPFEIPAALQCAQLGVTPFNCRGDLFSTASLFFRPSAAPLLERWASRLQPVGKAICEEHALNLFLAGGEYAPPAIARCDRRYNYNHKCPNAAVTHPVSVVHFNYARVERIRFWRRSQVLSSRLLQLLCDRQQELADQFHNCGC